MTNDTQTMTLTEFLSARIAEDEEVARAAVWRATDYSVFSYLRPGDGVHIDRHNPARVLAECEAKRQIVEMYNEAERRATSEWPDPARYAEEAELGTARSALVYISRVYADHPDYRQEWAR